MTAIRPRNNKWRAVCNADKNITQLLKDLKVLLLQNYLALSK
jgi:hypothetical protein